MARLTVDHSIAIAPLVFQCSCGLILAHEDVWGHHLLTCDSAGEWLRSHNYLRDIWMRVFRQAGFTPSYGTRTWGFLREPLGGHGQGGIMVPDWVDGRVLVRDVRRTHPVQQNPRAERLASDHTGGCFPASGTR